MYILTAIINGELISSDIFSTLKEAGIAQDSMLNNWGIKSDIEAYDSEPSSDGYDYDKYQ
jgi:hypothetical protein